MENKRTCAIVQDLLPSYVDKMTKPETTAFVDAHLTDCESCRKICRAMAGDMPPEAIQTENIVRRLKQKRYRRLALGWSIAAAVMLVAAICLLPVPQRIDVTYDAIIWQCGVPEVERHTTITVTGTSYDYLFREDRFEGRIWVEALPETHGELHFSRMLDGQQAFWYETEEALLKSVGSMLIAPDASRVVLCLYDETGAWSSADGMMLTAPAVDRFEAVRAANILVDEYDFGLRKFRDFD